MARDIFDDRVEVWSDATIDNRINAVSRALREAGNLLLDRPDYRFIPAKIRTEWRHTKFVVVLPTELVKRGG